ADNSQIGATLRETVMRLNREAPVNEVKTMNTVLSEAVSAPRSTTFLFVVFAGLALTLGIIGVYGVLSLLVSNRTNEIEIRMALGAPRRSVALMVIKESAKLSFAGIALGLAGALVVTRLLSGELYGVNAKDPLTFCGVTLVAAAVSLLACYIPARRAMR